MEFQFNSKIKVLKTIFSIALTLALGIKMLEQKLLITAVNGNFNSGCSSVNKIM